MDGYYKGRRVLEYRTMGDFTKGQNFVQHLLPHPWAGTGHVVYNGSLYYNKHQSNILVGDWNAISNQQLMLVMESTRVRYCACMNVCMCASF